MSGLTTAKMIPAYSPEAKNWLFSGNLMELKASVTLYGLIKTAKANGLEPYSYLRHIFTRLPLAKTLEDFEALLPWNLDARTIAWESVPRGGVK